MTIYNMILFVSCLYPLPPAPIPQLEFNSHSTETLPNFWPHHMACGTLFL